MIERRGVNGHPPIAIPAWVTSGAFRLVCDGEDEFEDRIEREYRDLDVSEAT